MQAALRLVRLTTELRGAVATVRWFGSGALRLYRYVTTRRVLQRHTQAPIEWVFVVSDDDRTHVGRSSVVRSCEPPAGVAMEQVEAVRRRFAVGELPG